MRRCRTVIAQERLLEKAMMSEQLFKQKLAAVGIVADADDIEALQA